MSPAVFQHVMNNILKGLTGFVVYQNDINIHAVDMNSLGACLLALFRRFRDHDVAVNPNKCMFAIRQCDCPGYSVIEHGFRPDPTRLAPLLVNELYKIIFQDYKEVGKK